MNLIDNWQGYYEYGEGYRLPQFGKRVKITVTLQGSNDNFIGKVKEEASENAVPLEATIKGFTQDDFISFVKTYPKAPRLKEFGNTDLVMERGRLEIEHNGYIDTEFDALYGTWCIVEKNYDAIPAYGSWLLKRVK